MRGAPPNKPLKLTAESVGATIRGVGQGSPGWGAHGKLHAGRSLAAIRWAAIVLPKKAITVRFLNRQEIRMGSPYKDCRVSLSGQWFPQLPDNGDGFLDLKAWSPDGKHLALVRWNIDKENNPGFNVYVISVRRRSLRRYRRIRGCCESIAWERGGFRYRAYAINEGKVRL
jgi:hypothetical protein